MKFKNCFFVSVLLLSVLCMVSCKSNSGLGQDDELLNKPNFVADPCGGCPAEEYIGSVTGIRFFSYVKNIGGDGVISMTIGAGSGSATQQFIVTAGVSYVFQASVPVEASATSSFTYQALFPGTAGYTDTHNVSGYRTNGAPFNLQMNPR